jgi:LysR substrate binding domain
LVTGPRRTVHREPGGPSATFLFSDAVAHQSVAAYEPRMLAVASSHPLARRERVLIEDLGDYKVVAPSMLPDDHQEDWVPFSTPSGRPIERLAERPGSFDEIALLVARGRAVHPGVPSTQAHLAPPNVALVPIGDLPPLRVVLLAKREEWNPRLREFVRIAREVMADRAA